MTSNFSPGSDHDNYLKSPLNIRHGDLVEGALLKMEHAFASETPQSERGRHVGVRWISPPHGAVARKGGPVGGFPPQTRIVVARTQLGAGRAIVDRIVVRQRGAQVGRRVLHVMLRVRLMRVPNQVKVVTGDQELGGMTLL